MKIDKFEKGQLTGPDEEKIRDESERAVENVSGRKYHALRLFYFPIWPDHSPAYKGEPGTRGENWIRTELDKVARMPLYDRDELLHRYGFMSRDERLDHDNSMRANHPDAEEIKPNHGFYPGEEWYAIMN